MLTRYEFKQSQNARVIGTPNPIPARLLDRTPPPGRADQSAAGQLRAVALG